MPPRLEFPLDLALPALRHLSLQHLSSSRGHETLVASNTETDLFVYMLRKSWCDISKYIFFAAKAVTQFYACAPGSDCGVLLSATAYAGQENATAAYAAFSQGVEFLSRAARCEIPLLPPDQCDLSRMDAALARLSQASRRSRRMFLRLRSNCCCGRHHPGR